MMFARTVTCTRMPCGLICSFCFECSLERQSRCECKFGFCRNGFGFDFLDAIVFDQTRQRLDCYFFSQLGSWAKFWSSAKGHERNVFFLYESRRYEFEGVFKIFWVPMKIKWADEKLGVFGNGNPAKGKTFFCFSVQYVSRWMQSNHFQ